MKILLETGNKVFLQFLAKILMSLLEVKGRIFLAFPLHSFEEEELSHLWFAHKLPAPRLGKTEAGLQVLSLQSLESTLATPKGRISRS